MRTLGFAIALVLAAFLLTGLVAVLAQQGDLDRELEEAKALYRDAKFAQALAKLQEIITRMRALQDLQVRKAQLADAYLHLALSYLALNDPLAAKDTLKQMVRLDRDRRLDPDVYAPKVIELFEQARAEVAAEPPPTASAAPPGPEARKKSSKLPYVLIGAGGAAAGGIAAASRGGGASTTLPPAPAVSTSTTTTVPSAGQADITFIGSDPPPGTTISVSRGTRLALTFSIFSSVDLPSHALHAGFVGPERPNTACAVIQAGVVFSLRAGTAETVTEFLNDPNFPRCPLPFTTTVIEVTLFPCNPGACFCCPVTVVRRVFNVQYTFAP